MTAKKSPLRLLILAGTAAAVLGPWAADSGTCDFEAARNLLGASYVDTALNPSGGEDLDFLYREGGVPNILVFFDSSGAMQMLPPDGPGKLGGATPTYPAAPTVYDLGTNYTDTAALNQPRVVGCGLDDVSKNDAAWMASSFVKTITARRFFPPCGRATDMSLVGTAYRGQTTDYAQSMTVCPYFTSSNNQATGAAGYDPDFYPTFFGRDLVFHDNAITGTSLGYANNAFGHDFGDGWSDVQTFPFQAARNTNGTVADFCRTQGTTKQGALTREEICNACLSTAGWYFDGFLVGDPATYSGKHPSLWYTGNYLNFFPPKFLAARKIMKDVIAVQSRIRMAMASFDATGANVFKEFNPSCGMPDGSNFDSNRAAYVSGLDSSSNVSFTNSTAPLANALFDIGRYYHSPDLPWFGNTWEDTKKESSSTDNQYAVCYSCQASTVILLTGGAPTTGDGTALPPGTVTQAKLDAGVYAGDTGTGITGIGAETTPICKNECSAFSGTKDYLNNLPRVAWYLQNTDLRKNSESTLDCKSMGGVQRIQTYTVGFGTAQSPEANTVLRNTAAAGKGLFIGAEDPSQLKDGLNYLLQEISTRSTSFSVATISTLQTTAGRAVIVPRFDPAKSAHWKGHLFRFDLYSEFVNDCTPSGTGDLDCDGNCVSTFLSDNSGSDGVVSLVGEDGNGSFVRNDPADRATCAVAPKCSSSGKCGVPGNAPAVPFWDAGDKLAARRWRDRKVYTAVDSDGNGRIDQHDATFQLSTATDAAAEAIVPYLGLGTNASGTSVCTDLAAKLTAAQDPDAAARVVPPAAATAAQLTASKVACAKTIIRYVLGADVFNEKGAVAPAWPVTDPESLPDRDYKLGDVFHSSPQVVEPPFPRTGIMCRNGLTTQCGEGLWATPTSNGPAGYDAYALSREFQYRDKIVLVGANDGLLHAFKAGIWIPNPTPGVHNAVADDPFTSKVDESLPPFNGYYSRGDADELWAFVTPDLLSKLPLLIGARHQFYVDGDPWVRDVWVDGTTNGLNGEREQPADDVKDGREFHTVAVVGERRGGTRFFALDVTSATNAGQAPKFLWIYPQPNDPESLTFGETYNGALPHPPPIVPLRIEATGADTRTVTPTDNFREGTATRTIPYHERWVAWLNGGFDPQYVRGRGVHAVDVWTGDELFDFSYPLDATGLPDADPRKNLRFPIPAAVGNMAWGDEGRQPNPAEQAHKYFFDTATFGDAGGQTWVVRYYNPGRLSGGKVTNWTGARAFQMGGQVPCKLCAAQPIFYITNNMRLNTLRTYRVGFGTGDRYNLLDKLGGTCGPDNIRACVMRGCTVTVDPAFNQMEATGLGFVRQGLSEVACGDLSNTQSTGTTVACALNGSARVAISCPDGSSTTKNAAVACSEQADGYRCETTASAPGDKLLVDDGRYPIPIGNLFASLLVFEPSGARSIFTNESEAEAYDAARITFNQTGASTYSTTTGVVVRRFDDNTLGAGATEDSPGWILYYGHGPSVTVDTHTFTVDWRDERTSSTAVIGAGPMTWYATQPSIGEVTAATTTGCRVSKCTAFNRRLSYHYGADPATGQPVLKDELGNLVRSVANYVQVPSQGDQRTVFVNQQGQVAVGLTSVSPEKGATNVGMSDPVDPTADVGFLEIDEELHACRHVDGVTTQPVCR